MRKTEVIRVRCTPEEKADWELQAVADGGDVSKLIRQRMNRGHVLVVEHDYPEGEEKLVATRTDEGFKITAREIPFPARVPSGLWALSEGSEFAPPPIPILPAAPQEDVDTSDEVGANLQHGVWKADDFESADEHLAKRRRVTCDHGRPTYVFCPACDA